VNAPVQYGARIAAFAIYLTHQQMLPQKRLVALMADLFGVRIAAATIEGKPYNNTRGILKRRYARLKITRKPGQLPILKPPSFDPISQSLKHHVQDWDNEYPQEAGSDHTAEHRGTDIASGQHARADRDHERQ